MGPTSMRPLRIRPLEEVRETSMGFIATGPGHKGRGERRVLAWPAARLALAIAAGILLVSIGSLSAWSPRSG